MPLKDWTIRRVADAMTVKGKDAETGAERKLVRVQKIEVSAKEGVRAIAIMPSGERHDLL